MSAPPDITIDHRAILRAILRAHLPAGTRVHVFGSRAHGGARRYSDLDLALSGDRPIDPGTIAALAEALSESDLPYRVDLVDLAIVDPGFRDRIMRDATPFPW